MKPLNYLMILCLLLSEQVLAQVTLPPAVCPPHVVVPPGTYFSDGPIVKLPLPPVPPLLPPNADPPDSCYRNIMWVHGLGGSESSWSLPSGYVEASYKVYNDITSYANLTDSILTAAQNLRRDLVDMNDRTDAGFCLPYDKNKSFVIAHSLGGMVSRRLFRMYKDEPGAYAPNAGGLVTFGTPHHGAAILNNQKAASAVLKDFCSYGLLNVWGTELEDSEKLLFRFVGKTFYVANLADSLCTEVVGLATPLFGFGDKINRDIAVGAPLVNQLNAQPLQLPSDQSVSFYGVEEAPAFWRTMYFYMDGVPGFPNARVMSFPTFGANDDQPAVDEANANTATALNHQARWRKNRDNWKKVIASPLVLSPPVLLWALHKIKKANKRIEAYGKSYEYWRDANGRWMRVIGETYGVTDTVKVCECRRKVNGIWEFTEIPVTDQADCQADRDCRFMTRYTTSLVSTGSDGIVTVPSARLYPGCTQNDAMPKSNHAQMRNDDELKKKLDGLLLLGKYGDYFKTQKKQ